MLIFEKNSQYFPKNSKFIVAKIAKMNGSCWVFKITKNWFHEKSEWQKNPEISRVIGKVGNTVFRVFFLAIRDSKNTEWFSE